jgi:hypothetical protein
MAFLASDVFRLVLEKSVVRFCVAWISFGWMEENPGLVPIDCQLMGDLKAVERSFGWCIGDREAVKISAVEIS